MIEVGHDLAQHERSAHADAMHDASGQAGEKKRAWHADAAQGLRPAERDQVADGLHHGHSSTAPGMPA
jgi:hypothetical protein